MPLFEYACKQCGVEFEELVTTPEDKPVCPKCGSKDVEKLMSACAIKSDGAVPAAPVGMPPMGGGCSGGG